MGYVLYTAYGSNMFRERFLVYIKGGEYKVGENKTKRYYD